MKTANILNDFRTYQELLLELDKLYFQYQSLMRRMNVQFFREQVLHEKVSEDEREKIAKQIADLESSIEILIPEISEHMQRMKGNLKKENTDLPKDEIDTINRDHADAMSSYNYCVSRLKTLESRYTDWDFSKVDFSKLDSKKMQLNIAIKKYNEVNLKLMDYKLYDVFEAQEIAKNEEKDLKS